MTAYRHRVLELKMGMVLEYPMEELCIKTLQGPPLYAAMGDDGKFSSRFCRSCSNLRDAIKSPTFGCDRHHDIRSKYPKNIVAEEAG